MVSVEATMRTLGTKYLGGLEIKEDAYKADLAILDRYQSFSSEILRLALLGIAGYGFLISDVVFKIHAGDDGEQLAFLPAFTASERLLFAGVVALGFSAMAALAHRYFSTDCLTHFVRRIRLIKQRSEESNEYEKGRRDTVIEHEEKSLYKDLRWCRWLLILACVSLAIGTICFAATVVATLFS